MSIARVTLTSEALADPSLSRAGRFCVESQLVRETIGIRITRRSPTDSGPKYLMSFSGAWWWANSCAFGNPAAQHAHRLLLEIQISHRDWVTPGERLRNKIESARLDLQCPPSS